MNYIWGNKFGNTIEVANRTEYRTGVQIDLNTPTKGAGNEGKTSTSTNAHSINFETMKLLKNDWFNLAMVMSTFFTTVANWQVGTVFVVIYFVFWVLAKRKYDYA